jgi:hypothetical protein
MIISFGFIIGEVRHDNLVLYFRFLQFPLGRSIFYIFIGVGVVVLNNGFDSALALGSIGIAVGILNAILLIPGLPPASRYEWNIYAKAPVPETVKVVVVPQNNNKK